MARHSLPFSAVPASAPTSPAVPRSKSDRNPLVTPQRTQRAQLRQLNGSPYTPATSYSTPFTPLSLRSFSSSNGSSLATPGSEASAQRRLSLPLSPETSFSGIKSKKGVADVTDNWRTRASENGIKVAQARDDSQFADDEDDSGLDFDTSGIFTTDKVLLPAPFLSTQRRARTFTQAQPEVHSAPVSQLFNSSVQFSTPARPTHSQSFAFSPAYLNTPPPKPEITNKYRLRGTVTDPAHTRRRPAFGQSSELCDIDEDEFVPYPSNASYIQSQTLPINLNDPFNFSIAEESVYYDAQSLPEFNLAPESPVEAPLSCSVCGTSKGSLAVLEPCTHPLCSACLTSALNIVGEKDMECAVCKAKVDDFKLQRTNATTEPQPKPTTVNTSCGDALFNPPFALDGGFDDFIDRAQGASTPVLGMRPRRKSGRNDERVVLRIDNVPWDITPPAIAAWLKHPVERVHVLLDRKGKTLSHAFAEMASPEAAKAALRTSQNSVLGKGKRARGVTVTRSNQEELMRALFPSWQGNFDGARPSLSGLRNESVIAALQQGLMSESELKSLMHLIRSPDSHFLKVPSLPFHSLIGVLSKFPSDGDSRVFWSTSIRDLLFDVTFTAVQILLARIEENPFSEWTSLAAQIVRSAMDCHIFTSEQMSKLSDILEVVMQRPSPPSSGTHTASRTPESVPFQPSRKGNANIITEAGTVQYRDLAKEFGVDAHLVEALAHRLSKLS